MASRTPKAPPAPKPFDSPDRADLVIITCDGTALYVVKAFLIYASQFFANLLGDSLPDETHEGFPVYRASEDCRTMCAVLRLCYPVETAPSEIIVDMPVLDALQRYMMEDAKERWKKTITFLDLAKTQPLRIFAIACRCRWADIARAAAKAILSIPIDDWRVAGELRTITAMDYHFLVQYHTQCSRAVEQAFASLDGAGTLILPLQSRHDALKLRSMMISCRDTKAIYWCSPEDRDSVSQYVHVPNWVHRLVENARNRLRNCPGRSVKCDESLIVAAFDAGKSPSAAVQPEQSGVLQVCEMIDGGVRAVMNKVTLQLDFVSIHKYDTFVERARRSGFID